jgi:hypothetical protein
MILFYVILFALVFDCVWGFWYSASKPEQAHIAEFYLPEITLIVRQNDSKL